MTATPGNGHAGATADGRTAHRLAELAAYLAARETVTVGAVLDRLGRSSFGLVMIILAVPALMPIPGPFGMVFGLAIILVSLQLVLGRTTPRLPAAIGARQIGTRALADVIRKSLPWIERLERLHSPGRMAWLTGARAAKAIGVAMLVLGVAIALPIPFGNILPVIATVMISLALLARDGLALMVGLAAGVIACMWSTTLVWFGAEAIAAIV